jgi:hypothetical protein
MTSTVCSIQSIGTGSGPTTEAVSIPCSAGAPYDPSERSVRISSISRDPAVLSLPVYCNVEHCVATTVNRPPGFCRSRIKCSSLRFKCNSLLHLNRGFPRSAVYDLSTVRHHPPALDKHPRFGQAAEHFPIQELASQFVMEALDVPVFPRAAGRDVYRAYTALGKPLLQGLRNELRAVVATDISRGAIVLHRGNHHLRPTS